MTPNELGAGHIASDKRGGVSRSQKCDNCWQLKDKTKIHEGNLTDRLHVRFYMTLICEYKKPSPLSVALLLTHFKQDARQIKLNPMNFGYIGENLRVSASQLCFCHFKCVLHSWSKKKKKTLQARTTSSCCMGFNYPCWKQWHELRLRSKSLSHSHLGYENDQQCGPINFVKEQGAAWLHNLPHVLQLFYLTSPLSRAI